MHAGKQSVGGVILAAGLSKRFGADKLSFHLSGQPVAAWVVKAACQSVLTNVVVVCRKKLLPHLPSSSKLRIVINPAPQTGQASSLHLGLRELSGDASHILFLLADQPLITSDLINHFVTLAKNSNDVACLKSDDYLGPPALFGKKWFNRLTQMKGDSGARQILMAQRKDLKLVPTEFKGQECDIDHQNDIAKLQRLSPAVSGRSRIVLQGLK